MACALLGIPEVGMGKHLRQADSMEWYDGDGHDVEDGRSARSRQSHERLQPPSQFIYIPPSHSDHVRAVRSESVKRGTPGKGHRSLASTIGRVIALVIGVAVVLLLAVGGLTAYNVYNSAKRIASEASSIMACVDKFETAARDGDPQALRSAASDINGSAHGIQNELSSHWWALASLVPVYGSDVKNARTLADSMVDLSDNALSPLAYDSGVLSLSKLVSDGAINVDAISSLASTCQTAQPIVRRDAEAINALPDAHIEQFATVFRKVRGRLSSVDDALTKANRILPALPDMLGAGGQEKTYLVIAMSNAEMRAAGGFPGAWGELTVVDGRMSVANFDSIVHEEGFTSEDAGGEDAMLAGLSDTGYYSHTLPADMTTSPDFTRDGWLMASAWEHFKGTHVVEDLRLEAVGATDPLQQRRVAAVAAPEAHVVAHDDRPRPEQPLQPGAHELLGALVGEVEGVVDHEDRVQAGGGQGREPVRQGGDHGQVGLGPVNQHRVRVEGDGHRQRATAVGAGHLPGAFDDTGEDGLVPAVDAVEYADGDNRPGSLRIPQPRGHLPGAVPDLHCGQSCSRSTRRTPPILRVNTATTGSPHANHPPWTHRITPPAGPGPARAGRAGPDPVRAT